MGEECTTGTCAMRMWEESRLSLPDDFPFTAVYSKRDGITDWRACIDPVAEPREVRTSHVGMALDPAVLRIVTGAVEKIQCRPLALRRPGWAVPQTEVG
jgi:triacylglycerol lipase